MSSGMRGTGPGKAGWSRGEIGLWRALWWAVRGRRDVGPGELPLPYSDRFTVVQWALCCLARSNWEWRTS